MQVEHEHDARGANVKLGQLLWNVDNFYELDDKFWKTALISWLDYTRNMYIYIGIYICNMNLFCIYYRQHTYIYR